MKDLLRWPSCPMSMAIVGPWSGLEDIRGRGIAAVVNLGDCFYGPLDRRNGAALLMRHRWSPCAATRQDPHGGRPDGSTRRRALHGESLAAEHLAWVDSLPLTARVGACVRPVATEPPGSTSTVHDVGTDGARRRRARRDFRDAWHDRSPSPVRHDHVPALAELEDGRLVVDREASAFRPTRTAPTPPCDGGRSTTPATP